VTGAGGKRRRRIQEAGNEKMGFALQSFIFPKNWKTRTGFSKKLEAEIKIVPVE